MSHITTIKTDVTFKDKNILVTTLNELQTQFNGLTYTYDKNEDLYTIHYGPLDNAYKWQTGNLRFIKSGDQYIMQGDSYLCYDEFNKVTSNILVNYQKNAVKQYLTTKRYSSNISKSKDGILLTARRY